ncbi:MAG: undecaprenyldiphospho-muramoylpentapeptide beta-N-acetylglucosaminyltransferase [Candidatus Nealsonbacteria bacterium CG_4_9_14_3_um_filter_35_11]|uniref:UDP-N-acetylglucosamine--N-acetylmuramyl-(pentapeptide) pyrophosphoryl-undecaprenol N-acetylglucosamine transferase n=2 Tax=Candidatus Nealsoniibacteriota TaxID=1817911 RepID=A0A2M7DBF9_9BACT|nr:MAG: undecaprenyldiphospho-muramoylpentapeptide beta-N-acetylglucosaminyltransferase [Candidatus Nealsonbacteria bacterium CG11_big_fil_rev_8_21_14_0_20_35_11]PIV45786.1 MAG: undecaprenyldiphospho-muramoylpentapeptide beta-N-acetylglucosaminyltransferase [Candidatus Nealsonbacteria bacterium CG02_land_8_20_14_3_00_34_20]PIW92514.1 MAG: undecaprenyldiphospho-muramoylpentapeptide beta-N-acetylglucosaminyltransferase [Candidatus Nealsonbacteria bacterium CG_4_8_14_3_um_filter_34_13]PIZ90022.1 MA
MKILFTGGGTGGHIFPIIAVARELKKVSLEEKLILCYMGPEDDFASIFLPQEEIKTKFILSGKIRRYWNFITFFQNIFDILIKIPLGIIQSFLILFFWAPDIIFSKGGYGSLPVVLSGWILRIPILLHESDAAPGLANRILSKFAHKIFVSFPLRETEYFPLKKMLSVGNPIREELLRGNREEAKNIFKLNYKKPVILIFGGSQGSERINEMLLEILPQALKDFEIIHQAGEKNYYQVKRETEAILSKEFQKNYHLYSFLRETELKHAMAAVDCIIARAGSGTIFEIAALGKPSILIPLPEAAQNHQVKNAYAFAKSEACMVLEETNLTPHFFLEKLKNLFSLKANEKMARRAKEFSKPEAVRTIAQYILEYLK